MKYFTKGELCLWGGSVLTVLTAFFLFHGGNYLNLTASLIGVTSLIFAAKGSPAAQFMMIIFSILYGVISWHSAYYGEMVTYLGMTMPMAVVSLISWLRHPYQGDKSQVEINHIKKQEIPFLAVLTIIVTMIFYFILKFFHTANLLFSTISVTTSFVAVYLTFRRSPYYALAYAGNDIVLIILWILAALKEPDNLSVVVCFAVFLINDIYGFRSWKKMEKKQREKI